MQDNVVLTGIIIKVEPIGDYDRRVVILTKERGKISAFAKGARKPNSRFVASTNPFVFGKFSLYEGRNSYSVNNVEVNNFFEGFRDDINAAYYGMYLLEIADYYTRENNDEVMMLKLLYQSLRALLADNIDNRLVRAVYEIKSTVVNGEFPGIIEKDNQRYSSDAEYAVSYIVASSVEKLYTFALSESVLDEVVDVAKTTCKRVIGEHFNSLDLIAMLG